MKTTLALIVCLAGAVNGQHSIRPGNGMQWGDWGPTEYCPSNSYATGFALRVENPIGDGDDTALNAIQLFCRSRSNNEVGTITSSVQDFGEWTGKQQCRNGRLNAIRMRVEGRQGDGDDTAANNLDMRCENGEELSGGGTGWGSWSSWIICPNNLVICGIQTRVEGKQGKGDDTALNDAAFYCC